MVCHADEDKEGRNLLTKFEIKPFHINFFNGKTNVGESSHSLIPPSCVHMEMLV